MNGFSNQSLRRENITKVPFNSLISIPPNNPERIYYAYKSDQKPLDLKGMHLMLFASCIHISDRTVNFCFSKLNLRMYPLCTKGDDLSAEY